MLTLLRDEVGATMDGEKEVVAVKMGQEHYHLTAAAAEDLSLELAHSAAYLRLKAGGDEG